MSAPIRFSDSEQQAGAPFRAHTEQMVNAMNTCGCVVLENFLPRGFVDKLANAFFERIAGWDETTLIQKGKPVGERRFMYLQPLAGPFAEPRLYANALVLPALQALLGEHCVISTLSIVMALPGAGAQRMHRDNALPFGEDPLSGQVPPLAINLAIPLVDLNETTGATAQHLGSHRKIRPSSTFGFEDAPVAYLRKGDAYLMDYRLVHAGTPNRGTLPRPIIYLIYARHWYLDAENHLDQKQNYLLVPDSTLQKATPEQAHLLSRARLRQP
ncbi:hypothetical protein COW36_18360 [bacterium (Candidatus Blackallbacteria) CG17_big_fil_post_rev_8_21_14_2_50_48_46]|uniref:Phytanoyl-CoA dioxygenase n=1 Tax=bacterium (Candidatus Blackallbacteria) CG17_big_fil_post_rev_8_21_14_2_50_48_46 TaxID=2014261 RepID=A0A2M7G213_9BACT|nr:MAG: hypothetical protein COW64_00375 [bacterium (Candidatus Blackallbacteria) CG18_big_fil_WC_8_21_14_2_50_49_26]PIW15380.1 MAG: hypothetical protein COW36_18360 [bacterium (Candidatus Blackallbacteria) CG17_big_fil_post_rev_8_21_14_2_50_48_46]PIW49759.1 MAG: hypothetical protein COW20_05005 [bacterium (Candidatus Blackallbacteria) CG13_big_fil_rev_8_21_14_2_50_49_14]